MLKSNINYPVNIGNPREFSIMHLARLIIKLTKSKSKIIHKPLPIDDPKVRKPDITLAKSKLKWEPKIDLKKGLMKTIEHIEKL